MSFVDSLKKGLFGSEDEYDDQYIDDGPQMVNNNNGLGVGADEEDEEPAEGTPERTRWSTSMRPPSSRSFWSSPSALRMQAPLRTT